MRKNDISKSADEIRQGVLEHYRRAAQSGVGCGCSPVDCCSGDGTSERMGYSRAELAGIPAGADLGLGCGNPTAYADLKPGETVLDLGAGAGIDCFVAARKVGEAGRVIGVDMTPEMVVKARRNAAEGNWRNVEFRLGEIEHLPVADSSVDVIISNCVVNLVPDKEAVYREAWRVLKPGGRLAISDIVAVGPVPEAMRSDLRLWSQCAAGAMAVDDLRNLLASIGFTQVQVTPIEGSQRILQSWSPENLADYFASAGIQAVKPYRRRRTVLIV